MSRRYSHFVTQRHVSAWFNAALVALIIDIDMGVCGDGAMNNIQMVRSLQIKVSRSSEEHVDCTKSIFELAGEGGEAFGIQLMLFGESCNLLIIAKAPYPCIRSLAQLG
jgi:hypothetical protein